jgi:hypothetical protein
VGLPVPEWVAGLAENWQLAVWERATGRVRHVWNVPVGRYTDNSALAFDEKRGVVLFASGDWASRWDVGTGERTGRWELRRGLNDTLVITPEGKLILIRREWEEPHTWGKPSPRMMFRCKELADGGAARELYTLPDVIGQSDYNYLSIDGRYLLLNEMRGEVCTPRLFHATTGKVVALREAIPIGKSMRGYLSERGSTLVVSVVDKPTRASLYGLPDLKRIGEHGFGLDVDEKGAIGVEVNGRGISLYQVGNVQPLATFDLGRPPSDVDRRITGDGRYVGWGRMDGTVCVADVNRCLEQLTPFPRR